MSWMGTRHRLLNLENVCLNEDTSHEIRPDDVRYYRTTVCPSLLPLLNRRIICTVGREVDEIFYTMKSSIFGKEKVE
jgi:hypothetical protein